MFPNIANGATRVCRAYDDGFLLTVADFGTDYAACTARGVGKRDRPRRPDGADVDARRARRLGRVRHT